jgi:hypothetical protein
LKSIELIFVHWLTETETMYLTKNPEGKFPPGLLGLLKIGIKI